MLSGRGFMIFAQKHLQLVKVSLVVLAFTGACWVAYWLGVKASGQLRNSSEVRIQGLSIESGSLNFGEVWEDEKPLQWDLSIKNTTSRTIYIDDLITSCNCLRLEPRSGELLPGDKLAIHLDLELNRRTVLDADRPSKNLVIEIEPRIQGEGQSRETWKLHGVVNRRLILDQLVINFGESGPRGQSKPTRKIRAISLAAADLEARVDPPICNVQIKRSEEDRNRFELLITPKRQLAPGPFNGNLRLHVLELESGSKHFGASIPITGEVQPPLRALPGRVYLPSVPIGEKAESDVVLQVSEEDSMSLDHWETDSPETSVEPLSQTSPGDGKAFRIHHKVTKEGDQQTVVRFIFRKGDGSLERLPVEVYYRGELGAEKPISDR